MTQVKADTALCQGYANCVENAPSTFALDDEGTVTLLRDAVDGDDLDDVRLAVRSCPVSALSLIDPVSGA